MADSRLVKVAMALSATGAMLSTVALPPVAAAASKAGGAYGDDFGCVAALHGGYGVASVDGALESIGRYDFADVADLRNVKFGSYARGNVFAVGSGCKQDVAVSACLCCNYRQYLCCRIFW